MAVIIFKLLLLTREELMTLKYNFDCNENRKIERILKC